MPPKVAVATCRPVPVHAADDPLLLRALEAAGVDTTHAAWDDPEQDWSSYDLVVIRSTWDYPGRRDAFVDWAHAVRALANPADVVEWNTDKAYLGELGAAGVPVVPTRWFRPGDSAELVAEWSEVVVKPSVSAGAADTSRYAADEAERALAHIDRLMAAGRTAMLQPYLSRVDDDGETALIFIDGRFSHAMRKGPILGLGQAALTAETYREEMTQREPSVAELEVASQVLAAVPGGGERLLYARIDLIPGSDGSPVLIEAELTEPSLFLDSVEGSVDRLVDAIVRRLEQSTHSQ